MSKSRKKGKPAKTKPEAAKDLSTVTPKKRPPGVPGSVNDDRRCTATANRTGERCRAPAVRGGNVCRIHGGSAPQVRAKANERLLEMVMPSLARLRKIILDPKTSDADALKAIREVLNRTGFSERFALDVAPSDAWADLLKGVHSEVDLDRSLGDGGGKPELTWEDIDQAQHDAQEEAWREYDNEDADEVERGRIRPDQNTVRGEVVDTNDLHGSPIRRPDHEPQARVEGSDLDPHPQGPNEPPAPSRYRAGRD